ncbi:protein DETOXIFICATION 27-like isoform X2 [Ziziphus jujuba]|uniref:Protein DETOXIFICATION n=1 Tax=Ziziphus jujuba TaxID=326968 RepID=A0ABM3IL74_ZIZJJ|nr:protein DETOXIFICATION 27-like isoform X2 [Ziziphus jujuba]
MIQEEENDPLLISHRPQKQQDESETERLIIRTWLESKKIWQIAGPSIFSRLAMFFVTVIVQSFAGHLSDLDLAAISIGTTVIISLTFGFLLGMASVLETLCGQAYGAKQYHMLGIYMQRSWIVLFFCAVLLLPLFIFATPILKFIGQPDEVAERTGLVALWLIPFHLSFPFQFSLQRFLQSQLQTGVIAWMSALVLGLHAFVSWVVVYKMRAGIVGSALTIAFAWWVSALGMFGYTVCGGCHQTWTGFSTQAFVGLWEFFKLSVASGVMLAITIYGWESMIPLGFLAATGVRVANELGAGNAKGAKFSITVSVFTSLAVGFLFWLIVMVFHEKLAMIFTSSIPVISMVNELAVMLAFTILSSCIQPVLLGVAVGSGWQVIAAFVNIGSYYLVGVPLGLLLGWLLSFGVKGTWTGLLSGTIVQTLILAAITLRCEWDKEVQKARINITREMASNQ